MKKVLIVTYYWPPAGGPGVQRILKFAKYLPLFGWQPVILTVKKGIYPAEDPSLKDDIDEDIKVFYSANPEPDALYRKFIKSTASTPIGVLATENGSWKKRLAHKIRMNYFIPDAKKYWRYFGYRTGKAIIDQEKPDLIFSSSPPPTTHLIARDLSSWSHLPWIADFRDPWSKIHYYEAGRSKKAQHKDKKLEQSVIKSCDEIICVSQKFSQLLEIPDTGKLTIIHNGYDTEDFKNLKNDTAHFRITYIGGLTSNRYYPDFFRTIRKLIDTGEVDSAKIKLGFAGNINPEIKMDIQKVFKEQKILEFHGYLPHLQATELMQKSDLLLLFNEKVTHYQGHLPGKLFEYLASGSTVLGIGDTKGEAAHIISTCKAGNIISPADDPATLILEYFSNWQKGISSRPDLNKIRNFDRKILTEKLANVFNKQTQST